MLSSGDHVSFHLLDNINSPTKKLTQSSEVYKQIKSLVMQTDRVIIRGPSEFGMMAAHAARELSKPYCVEMSGCAFDHTWHHGSWIGKLYAPLKYLRARHMIKHAARVLYVTERFLQRRYPHKGIHTHASNVSLPDLNPDILQQRLERIQSQTQPLTFGLIGNFNNHLKGLDIAFKALRQFKKHNPDCHLKILGHGDPQKWAHDIARYELQDHVTFNAPVTLQTDVLSWLDTIDIYIQPSRHEGLPRALIEAMSRGCPALASDAGGTDELLDKTLIHKRSDHRALTKHMINVCHPFEMTKHAMMNFKTAQRYTHTTLAPRRHDFYEGFTTVR